MKTWIYYHVSDHLGWMEMVEEKIRLMHYHGLWSHAEKIVFQMHYNPEEFKPWIESSIISADPKIEFRLFNQTPHDVNPSAKPLGETYSIIDMQRDCLNDSESRAIFRYSTKGLTHRWDESWPKAELWNQYLDYWNIEHWRLCLAAIEEGYDTVGANWHNKDDPQGHWSGTIFWASSNHLRRLPQLRLPHEIGFQNQLGGFTARHDAEVWISRIPPRYLELNHYEHACVYHVDAPQPGDYKFDR